jgi:hypothetical protein
MCALADQKMKRSSTGNRSYGGRVNRFLDTQRRRRERVRKAGERAKARAGRVDHVEGGDIRGQADERLEAAVSLLVSCMIGKPDGDE